MPPEDLTADRTRNLRSITTITYISFPERQRSIWFDEVALNGTYIRFAMFSFILCN
jgi:hypothetical protein